MKHSWKYPSLSLLLPMLLASSVDAEPVNIKMTKASKAASQSTAITEKELVQVALLLDTSGSMSGLIDQARCQLWNVVSELSKAERNGTAVALHIGVYQYGAHDIPAHEGHLRQVLDFTDNLDEVSAALFSLKTDGGDEYCGQVIGAALNDLGWSNSPDVYKAIFIAGNESFDQGKISYGELLSHISSKSVTVNTIFCGNKKESEQWDSAARLSGGLFAKIDHNHHLPEMVTPYDQEMRGLNLKMNKTFVWYGDGSQEAAKNQQIQDANAQKMSDHAFAARMSAKVGHLYHHVHNDLVDAIAHGKIDITTMPKEKMPEIIKNLTPKERGDYIEMKASQRQSVRRQMAELITKRHSFLESKMSQSQKNPAKGSVVLGDALVKAIRTQAESNGYVFTR